MNSVQLLCYLVTLLIVQSIPASSPTQNVLQDKSNKNQQKTSVRLKENAPTKEQQLLKPEPTFRHRKMFNILNYPQQLYSSAASSVFHPYDYLNEFPGFDGKDISSGPSSKLLPQSKPYENSPIYYVKLPPTPYMYVPGMGYMSEPSTIPSMPSHLPPTGINPFFNLPLNFMSNGRPSSIYQFGSDIRPHFPEGQYFPEPSVQRIPAFPSDTYPSDTKITSLKGNFLYNGRPEEIYVLPNGYKSFYRGESGDYY